MKEFLTLGDLHRETGISRPTLRKYCDAGWLDCHTDTTGRRLFERSAISNAKALLAERFGRFAARKDAEAA